MYWVKLRRNVRCIYLAKTEISIDEGLFDFSDGLYTKITGAQRVDLFGAQKADLPSIWKELVDVGFESGHAYGEYCLLV